MNTYKINAINFSDGVDFYVEKYGGFYMAENSVFINAENLQDFHELFNLEQLFDMSWIYRFLAHGTESFDESFTLKVPKGKTFETFSVTIYNIPIKCLPFED